MRGTDETAVAAELQLRGLGRVRVEGFRVGNFMVRRRLDGERGYQIDAGPVPEFDASNYPWAVEPLTTNCWRVVAKTEEHAWLFADCMAQHCEGMSDAELDAWIIASRPWREHVANTGEALTYRHWLRQQQPAEDAR